MGISDSNDPVNWGNQNMPPRTIPLQPGPIPRRPRKSEWKVSGSAGCLLFLAIALIVPLLAAANGFVISVFWRWFLMPIFPSLEPIGVLRAIGLAFFVGLFTTHPTDSDDNDSKWVPIITLVGRPFLALAFGWVLLQFIN